MGFRHSFRVPFCYISKVKTVFYEKLLTLCRGICQVIPRNRYLFAHLMICFLQKVLEKNDAGDHFPLYAICLGFEILTMIISKVSRSSFLFVIETTLWHRFFCQVSLPYDLNGGISNMPISVTSEVNYGVLFSS